MADVLQTGFTRVFLIENRAGPANVPVYQGLAKAGAVSWPQGDITTIKLPDSNKYDGFLRSGKVAGDQGDPAITITNRYTLDRSTFLRLATNGCDNDVQVHMGKCQNPSDFNAGWDKILVLEAARPTDYTTGDLGALQPDERALINEEIPFTGEFLFEIIKMLYAETASAEVVQEVVDIVVCDSPSCGGICGDASDGCQVVFAVTLSAGGSPGLSAEVLFTSNGGGTWGDTNVTTLAANEDPDEMECVGDNVVVVSQDSCSLHYAAAASIILGTETWTEIATGFVCPTGAPRAIDSTNPSHTWIVGAGGYIYFTDDPTAGVEVQSAGAVTTQQLNSVHAFDDLNVAAVGNLNAVVFTSNGGSTWNSVTGPAVGVNLNTIFMRSASEWYVGSAAGRLYFTRNSGTTWTEKAFPGNGSGQVRDIQFVGPGFTVGYMSHDTTTPRGRILRTISGGNSWYVAPEGTASMPLNDRINMLAVCADPNVVFGAGLADNAIDGFIIKGA